MRFVSGSIILLVGVSALAPRASGSAVASGAGALGAPLACEDVFVPSPSYRIEASPALSADLLSFESRLGEGSTTSLRREDKFVVLKPLIDSVLSTLRRNYGPAFQLRDKRTSGTKNVTVTQYAVPVHFAVPRDLAMASGVGDAGATRVRSAKIRLRKYFSAPSASPLSSAALTPSAVTSGRTFLELKIDHPIHDGVVVKPRLLISDADANLIQTRRRFLAERSALVARWSAENPSVPRAVVEGFAQTLADLYVSVDHLPLYAKTSYVRDSFSLMIPPADVGPTGAAAKPLEVQITVDREVLTDDSRTSRTVAAYSARDVVVEIKVPLAHAALSPASLATYPGLAEIAQLKRLLANHRDLNFAEGAGKLATFRSTLLGLMD